MDSEGEDIEIFLVIRSPTVSISSSFPWGFDPISVDLKRSQESAGVLDELRFSPPPAAMGGVMLGRPDQVAGVHPVLNPGLPGAKGPFLLGLAWVLLPKLFELRRVGRVGGFLFDCIPVQCRSTRIRRFGTVGLGSGVFSLSL